jgi:TolA-binding protein
MKRVCLVLLTVSLLAACSSSSLRDGSTLEDLKPAAMPTGGARSAPSVAPEKLIEHYRAALEVEADPAARIRISNRLADLEMIVGEKQQAEADESTPLKPDHYENIITNYKTLLAQNPDGTQADQQLYQLSKAYDLAGQTDKSLETIGVLVTKYPNSPYALEAQFRRGELQFARRNYADAQIAYDYVVTNGRNSSLYPNALYMQGWTRFKRNAYDGALESFTAVLDVVTDQKGDVSKAQQGLAEDSMRIMSTIFSYEDNGKSIAELYKRVGKRAYEPQLYERLGDMLVEKERYRDAADTYRVFIDQYPNSPWAPRFHMRLIDALVAGKFPTLLLPEKQQFVTRYGKRSEFWKNADPITRGFVSEHLKAHLDELARHYHASAQQAKRDLPSARDKTALEAQMANDYRLAAGYYEEYIASFPDEKDTAERAFMMAEALYESRQFDKAIVAYERTAYDYKHPKYGADAGYSAILSYDAYVATLPNKTDADKARVAEWQKQKIDSELRYAGQYGNDARALPVLVHAADTLLKLNELDAAIAAAQRIVRWQPPANAQQKLTAWLVIGHAQFDKKQYGEAQVAYREVLNLLPANDPRRNEITDRLAASTYKQGEQAVAAGKLDDAVNHFMQIGKLAPNSAIRANAEYDAGTYLLQMKQYDKAIAVLREFRNRYPQNPLTRDIPAKLIPAYEATGQTDMAAAEMLVLSQTAQDPEERRNAMMAAAELYEKSGAAGKEKALGIYRDYIAKYPEPFEEALEMRYKLAGVYGARNDKASQRYWLQQIIDADARAGAKRSDRSKYLAAQASSVFADEARDEFNRVKLTLPLPKSLAVKKTALDKALAAYKRTADYGVAEYATKAAYEIGEIYAQLSRDLMDSQRPTDLDEMALEQYEVLLEEQADPFVQNAIKLHEANTQRTRNGIYDEWVKKSFDALATLMPARFKKPERIEQVGRRVY